VLILKFENFQGLYNTKRQGSKQDRKLIGAAFKINKDVEMKGDEGEALQTVILNASAAKKQPKCS